MTIPDAGAFAALRMTNAQAGEALNAFLAAVRALPGAVPGASYQIAGGAIAPAVGVFRVETEGLAALDDLDRLSTSPLGNGSIVELSVVDGARAVRLRNAQGGAGQILLATSDPLVISSRTQWVRLVRDGNNWRELSRSYGNQTADARAWLGLGGLATANLADLLPVSSDDYEVTSGGQGEFEHGLGELPARWWATLRCVSDDAGYGAGDTIALDGGYLSSSPRLISIWAHDTAVGWLASNSGNPISVVNAITKTVQTVTLSSWRLKLWASRL